MDVPYITYQQQSVRHGYRLTKFKLVVKFIPELSATRHIRSRSLTRPRIARFRSILVQGITTHSVQGQRSRPQVKR